MLTTSYRGWLGSFGLFGGFGGFGLFGGFGSFGGMLTSLVQDKGAITITPAYPMNAKFPD